MSKANEKVYNVNYILRDIFNSPETAVRKGAMTHRSDLVLK